MGNHLAARKLSFEDVQQFLQTPADSFLLIHTLPEAEQHCLIMHTADARQEVERVNQLLEQRRFRTPVVVYGAHCNDDRVWVKQRQLSALGFERVFAYPGGLFEWMLLQDVFGADHFPTTRAELQLLKYKPPRELARICE
jgi:rhodanese-related sulfurtransferase